MYTIERVSEDYLKDLENKKEYWKGIATDENTGSFNVDIANQEVAKIDSKLTNFDESLHKHIETETTQFIESVIKRIAANEHGEVAALREGKPLLGARDDGTYTMLGFSMDDPIISDFIQHTLNVQGFVSDEKEQEVINGILSQYGIQKNEQESKQSTY